MSILDLANDLAAISPDMNEVVEGGGGFEVGPEGPCTLRYIGYIEIGQHNRAAYAGKAKPPSHQAIHLFEVSGKNYPPHELEGGVKIPHRVELKTHISNGEKSTHKKLFDAMNWEKKATSFTQLIGKAYLGHIHHYKYTDDQGKERTIMQITDSEHNHTVRQPTMTDPIEGTTRDLSASIPGMIGEPRMFVWNAPDKLLGQLWDSIHIPKPEGAKYDPNKYQNLIKKANNFKDSPIAEFLEARGEALDIPEDPSAEDLLGGAATTAAPAATTPPAEPAATTAEDAQAKALAALGM